MSIIIERQVLEFKESEDSLASKLHAFCCLPAPDREIRPVFAIMTHGYTSHKGSILNWAMRLAESGVSCFLFDLPGHFLGGFGEVHSFEAFQANAAKTFMLAHMQLKKCFLQHFPLYEYLLEIDQHTLILAGHSLGAFLALEATELEYFSPYNTINIGVGLGLAPQNVTHIFDTPFYQSTLDIRKQLVSKALSPDKIFSWIKQAKTELKLSSRRIHLISGLDDAVVGKDGVERLAKILEIKNNNVSIDRPTKLGHHLPDIAAPHIKKFLKAEGLI